MIAPAIAFARDKLTTARQHEHDEGLVASEVRDRRRLLKLELGALSRGTPVGSSSRRRRGRRSAGRGAGRADPGKGFDDKPLELAARSCPSADVRDARAHRHRPVRRRCSRGAAVALDAISIGSSPRSRSATANRSVRDALQGRAAKPAGSSRRAPPNRRRPGPRFAAAGVFAQADVRGVVQDAVRGRKIIGAVARPVFTRGRPDLALLV